MTSVVAAPEPPLGSKENPHPFKWEKIKIQENIIEIVKVI